MKDAIGEVIKELLEGFKRNYKKPKLWIGLIVLFFCAWLLFPYIDSNVFYFSRIEKRINVLERVMELDEQKIKSNKLYEKEYKSILQEIEQQRDRSINSVMNRISDIVSMGKEQGNEWIKFFSGAIWGLIITICVPFINTFKKRGEKFWTFIIMLIISILIGWLCSRIPIIVTPLVNYIGIPIIQIIVAIAITTKSDKKKKVSNSKKEVGV